MEQNIELWERFDERRAARGLGLVEFARNYGLSYDTLQGQYYSKSVPKVKTLYAIAQALETTMDYLYAGDEDEDFDTVLFRKLSQSQELIDICERLVSASREELKYVRRALDMEKNDGSNTTEKSIS